MLMISPLPWRIIAGSTCWMHMNAPLRFTFMISSKSTRGMSRISRSARTGLAPALLTSTSILPHRRSVMWTARRTSAGLRTSARTVTTDLANGTVSVLTRFSFCSRAGDEDQVDSVPRQCERNRSTDSSSCACHKTDATGQRSHATAPLPGPIRYLDAETRDAATASPGGFPLRIGRQLGRHTNLERRVQRS